MTNETFQKATELFQKAKACKSPDEILALAKENGVEMTVEEAAEKYAALHNEGELSDSELEGAAGGSCYDEHGRLQTTCGYGCEFYWRRGNTRDETGTCYTCQHWERPPIWFFGQPGTCINRKNDKR